jgi:hypothetical protein
MLLGRNDPCSCGSGKKYKKCCALTQGSHHHYNELLVKRVKNARASLSEVIIDFGLKVCGPHCLTDSWEDWRLEDEASNELSSTEQGAFLSWMFFNWKPKAKNQPATTLAERYLQATGPRLTKHEHAYLVEGINSGFSFFDLLSIQRGVGVEVEDLLTGKKMFVHEVNGSLSAQPGYILFGKLISIDEVGVFDGVRETLFPAREKMSILKFRQNLAKSLSHLPEEKLRNHELVACDRDIHLFFGLLREKMNNPQMPQLHNTDGEPFELCTVFFEHKDIKKVFDKLHTLSVSQNKKNLLQAAVKDEEGNLKSITFEWEKKKNKAHSSWGTTVLGNITLDLHSVKVEVNSRERSERIQKMIEKKCEGLVTFQRTEMRSIESSMQAVRENPRNESLETPLDNAHLQEIQKQMFFGHYMEWLEIGIPALDNQSPQMAVKSAEGRELVEALLQDIEPSLRQVGEDFAEDLITKMRQKLGLPDQD